MTNKIHQTAIIEDGAELGANNSIGPNVIIEHDVVLGDNNSLLAGVVVKSGTRIGDDNAVHEYAVLGGLPQDISFDATIPSYVEMGNNNTIREYVTIHRASQENQATVLGNENYLMTEVHLGHDCKLENNVIIAPGTGLGGFVSVEEKAFISGGVMVHQFVNIGKFAMIGGNAKITRDVLPFMMIDGNPARVTGLNKIGLRRAGFKAEEIRILKKAYQLIFNNEAKMESRLGQLSALENNLVEQLVSFVSASKRGFHRDKS